MSDYQSNPNWRYSGDVNAEYGGIWIRHYGDYCDAVEIIDLDSGCGFEGAVLIERRSVSLPRKLSEAKKRIRSALNSYGWTTHDLVSFGRGKRYAIWEALISYGYRDTDSVETLQLSSDGPMKFDGWLADRRQTRGDIGGYVMAKYLCQ